MKLPLIAASLAVASAAGTIRMETFKEIDYVRSREIALKSRSTSNTLGVPMYNLVSQYRMNVSIGTPPQSIVLAVDTGSSDVWTPEAQACGAGKSDCEGGYCKFILE
jgi:Eukaryotic aspartyl protease